MKLRKGLLAAATAATVSFSGVVAAPAFAEENATDTTKTSDQKDGDKPAEEQTSSDKAKKFGEDLKALSSDKDGNLDPKAIIAWIGVFTAIISALGSLFTFVDKYIKK